MKEQRKKTVLQGCVCARNVEGQHLCWLTWLFGQMRPKELINLSFLDSWKTTLDFEKSWKMFLKDVCM